MSKKSESIIVVLIALIAILSLVVFIKMFFSTSLLGEAIFPLNNDCGCTDFEKPVCGIDGETYRNNCVAICQGATIQYEGPCP